MLRRIKGLLVLFCTLPAIANAQYIENDSVKIEKLDEVLVKTVRVNKNDPVTHTNITKVELESRNLGQDLPILLNYLPSVVTTSDAGAGIGYTGIRVRGVSAQSTNITINSIPFNDAESMGTFWVDLPDFSSSVESLQVQRGIGTSTNGSGAFGASINILTDAFSENPYAEITNVVGSYNTRKHNLKFGTGRLNHDFELSGRLSQIKSDGYIDRAESDLKSYFVQGTFLNDKTIVKILVFGGHEITYQAWNGIDSVTLKRNRTFNPTGMYTNANGDIVFYHNEVDNYKQDHYQFHWNQKFEKNWSTNISLNYTNGRGFFENFREKDSLLDYGLDGVTTEGENVSFSNLIRRRWLDNDFYVSNLNASFTTQELDLVFGSSYSYYEGDHFGEVIWTELATNHEPGQRYYDGNGIKTDFSIFTKAKINLSSNIQLYGDLQMRHVRYRTFGINSDRFDFRINESFNFFNPKAGITFKLNNYNSLYFSFARANREPSRSDFENNTNIKPEQLNDFELGWRHSKNKLKLFTNIYYMPYKEQLVLTGAIDTEDGTPIRDNSGASYRLGLEFEGDIQFSKALRLQPNFTISSNKTKKTITLIDGNLANLGKTNIAFSPSFVASKILTYSPSNKLSLSVLSKYVSSQYMGNTNSKVSKLNAYFISDFNVVYNLKINSLFKSILFSGIVNNIFNTKYVSNGYYFTYEDTSVAGQTKTLEGAGYYPQAITNFLLGATLKF